MFGPKRGLGLRRNVRSVDQIQDMLLEQPNGKTPLSRRVREAMAMRSPQKPQLLLIATDGQPDSDYPEYVAKTNFPPLTRYANRVY